MGRETGVFPGEDTSLIGHELAEQGRVFVIKGIGCEIDFGFGTGSAFFSVSRASTTFAILFVGVRFTRHDDYLISRWSV